MKESCRISNTLYGNWCNRHCIATAFTAFTCARAIDRPSHTFCVCPMGSRKATIFYRLCTIRWITPGTCPESRQILGGTRTPVLPVGTCKKRRKKRISHLSDARYTRRAPSTGEELAFRFFLFVSVKIREESSTVTSSQAGVRGEINEPAHQQFFRNESIFISMMRSDVS